MNNDSGEPSGPLRNRTFRVVLSTNLGTALAGFMNGLAAAWVLTDITDSPRAVALLQVAVTVPGFALALVAGALADIVDRRRLLRVSLVASSLVAITFAVLSAADAHTQVSVLALTAALGMLTALAAPAWMAVVPALVRREQLADAMTLSSAGVSGAMAVGPALGGVIIAAGSPTWVFWINAAVFAAAVVALRAFRPPTSRGLPAEHLLAAMRLGLQYARHDRPLTAVIGKIIPFALSGTALVSLLPAVARFRLDAGPAAFGLLSGAGGVGAVVALVLLPHLRRRFGPDAIFAGASLVQAGTILVLATTTSIPVATLVLAIAGATSLAAISTVMTSLQIVLPTWIRGRGIAVYLLGLQGAFAGGAVLWGSLAEASSLRTALVISSVAMVGGTILVTPLRLARYADIDATEAVLMPEPPAVTTVHEDDGPIVVMARWHVEPARRDELLAAMTPVRRALKRQGALSFQLVEDVQETGTMVETFTMATWAEYRRLPHRSTNTDRLVHEELIDRFGPDLPELRAHRTIDLGRRPEAPTLTA